MTFLRVKWVRILAILFVIIGSLPVSVQQAHAVGAYKVVGYLSGYSVAYGRFATVDLAKVTDIVYQGVKVTSATDATLLPIDGSAFSHLTTVVNAATPYGIDVYADLCGKWNNADLLDLTDNATLRADLVANLATLTTDYNLTGIGIDQEDASMTAADMDVFVAELHTALDAVGKKIVFTARYNELNITTASLSYIEYFKVMAYDMDDPHPYPYHSLYDDAIDALGFWTASGFPKSKLTLGLPVFGRDDALDGTPMWVYYSSIVDNLPTTDSMDSYNLTTFLGDNVSGGVLWWGGPDLNSAKAQYIKDNGYLGVALYELGTDKLGGDSRSILTHVYNILAAAGPPAVAYRSVGYLSAWTMATFPTAIDNIEFEKLTNLVFANLEVTSPTNPALTHNGYSDRINGWVDEAVAAGHTAGIDVYVSLYSNPSKASTVLTTIADNATLRAQLITNLSTYVTSHNLDGVEFDFEDVNMYGARTDLLIDDLYDAGVKVSVSGGWEWDGDGINIGIASDAKVEWIDVMCYDMTYPPSVTTSPIHSSYADSIAAMQMWSTANFTKSKLVMGIPFYGEDGDGTAVLYSEIVTALNPAASENQRTVSSVTTTRGVISITGGVLWWNGIDLATQKVDWIKANGYAGVMMFDVGEDALNSASSLLTNIYNQLYPPGSEATLVSIAVTPASPSSLTVGHTQQFTATGTYSNNSTPNITTSVTWDSSNDAVATISTTGLATGVAPGSVLITATLSGISNSPLTLVVIASTDVPAGTYLDQPSSPPTLTEIHANRNVALAGDVLIYFLYNIPYATTPNATASDYFMFRLMNGATDLGEIEPYAYPPFYGFQTGLAGLYFSAADNLTWGYGYSIMVAENPLGFEAPVDSATVIPASAWSSFTTQADNQAELATNLYYMGQTLEPLFGVTFFQTAGDREVLTGEGEAYYRGAINGLQAMAPSLFLVQEETMSPGVPEYTTDLFDTYEHRYDGTWVGDSQEAIADQMGVSDDPSIAMAIIIVIPLSIVFIIFSSYKFRRVEPGFAVVPLILLMAVLMGWMPKAVFASGFQLTGIYSAFLVFYARG